MWENYVTLSYKVEMWCTVPDLYMCVPGDICQDIHKRTVHDSKKLETAQMSPDRRQMEYFHTVA